MSRSNGSHIYGPGTEVWGLWSLTASHSRHWYNSPNDTLYLLSSSEKLICPLSKLLILEWSFKFNGLNIIHARNENFDVGLDIRVNITNFLILEQIEHFALFVGFLLLRYATQKKWESLVSGHIKSHIWDLRSQQSSWWWHYTSRKLPSTIQRGQGQGWSWLSLET